jgi:ATP-dependent DNA ligase
VRLPQFQPLPLDRARAPFSHPDWIFEIKWDGFRSLLYSDETGVRLVSRNGNTFKSFTGLCEGLARDLKGRRCILDGEIVCLDSQGKPQFRQTQVCCNLRQLPWGDDYCAGDHAEFKLRTASFTARNARLNNTAAG